MKKIKLLTVLLCMLMVLGVLSGCNKSDDANGRSPEDTQGTDDTDEDALVEVSFDEHVTYTYWLPATPSDEEPEYSKNAVVEFMNNKFNMTLDFQQPAVGTEDESLNIMFGTGEYTDLIDATNYTGSIDELYNDGIIINIVDYLDYMPNFKALLEADEVFRKNTYNDNGQILKLPNYLEEDPLQWGGLVYRRDILEAMTGNNVVFPSGNEIPTTIEDWDYMLPLMKQYFDHAQLPESAPLIIPAPGYFITSELLSGFGASATYYLDGDTIKYGPIEDGFYNYLEKMNDWYSKGYIYKDFASRTNDPFYLPNTSLTYGGAAGIWFGMTGQLGDAMSMEEYGLFVDVHPLLNPIDAENGITKAPHMWYAGKNEQITGTMVSSSTKNIERLLTTIDYMFSEEGGNLKEYGITKEQGAAEYELYKEYGLEDGAYYVDSEGNIIINELLSSSGSGATLSPDVFVDYKMPGLRNNKYTNLHLPEMSRNATDIWIYYGTESKLPPLSRTTEEDVIYTTNQPSIDDYINTMVLNFILGNEELNEVSWDNYVKQVESFGIEENISVMQAAYERYLNR